MPGCVKLCVMVGSGDRAVTGVPSSKSHRYRTFDPPVTLTAKVADPPTSCGAGDDIGLIVNGPDWVMVQTKLLTSLLTPSLAATTTLKIPEAVAVPVIRPVVPLIDSPAGKPLAP